MDSWIGARIGLLGLLVLVTFVTSHEEFSTDNHHRDRDVLSGSRAFVFPTRASEVGSHPILATRAGATPQRRNPVPVPSSSENHLDVHFTSTRDLPHGPANLEPTKSAKGLRWPSSISRTGEGLRAPREQISVGPNSANATLAATPAPKSESKRKTGPDIHEIITGFVKLLNGNVQLQTNPNNPHSLGRPVRTRINNRGPPRITDLPPILLDPPPPSLMPPPLPPDPHPYPFEKPLIKPFVSGVPVPEQIVPTESNPVPVFSSNTPVPSMRPPLRPTRPYKPPMDGNKLKNTTKTFVQPTLSTATTTTTSSESIATTTSTPEVLLLNTTSTTEVASFASSVDIEPTPSTATSMTIDPTPTSATSATAASTLVTTIQESSTESTYSTSPKINESSTEPTLIESSIVEVVTLKDTHQPTSRWEYSSSSTVSVKPSQGPSIEANRYAPRPGIVLDDPEYKPGLKRPILTAPPKVSIPPRGEVFDVTVSAVQGPTSAGSIGQPVVYPVELEGVNLPGAGNGEVSVITSAEAGQHFVSIDGKRTYINLFGNSESSTSYAPTSTQRAPIKPTQSLSGAQRPHKRPIQRRPLQPPVRIDTCIVGDWSTCDSEQHEICKTELGVSSCHCAPGYSRHSHRQPCKRIVSIVASIKLEKIYDQKLSWSDKLADEESQEYIQLEYEINRAMDSAMSMTPFSDAYMGSKLNNVYTAPGSVQKPVFVNLTLQMEESSEALRPQIKGEIQKQLLGAIHRRNSNLGTSPIWAAPTNGVSALQDLDECQSPELNDCHVAAFCHNVFGSFECTCQDGYKDEFANNPHKSGRRCETCSPDHCNHRGKCSYKNGQPVCLCTGNYYGSQCEVDGEVLGVAIGASVAAVIIILSTLACLCMWSRKWNREQKMAGMGSPVFGYMPTGGSTVKTPGVGSPPYQVSLEDRLRWAQIADAMAHANHYAPEPVGVPTRPASALYGYGGTLPIAPVPLPRLGLRPASVHNMKQDSSSEEEDKTDLLGRNFHVPRPKSRSSIANQSGIYYDVDYEQQGDHFSTTKQHPGIIPLNTYTMGRAHYYRT